MNNQPPNESIKTPAEAQIFSSDNVDAKVRQYITQLRFKFLTPIIITLSFAVLLIIIIVYFHEYRTINSGVLELKSTTNNLFQNSIQQDAKALQTVMDVLKTDSKLSAALAKHDRLSLLQRSIPIYENINRHYGITHFYFTDAERVNLLRVHKPEKYGDTINRQTTLTAQQGGTDAYGIELGPLGTLTLRYVQPWYEEKTRKLLGFVELGMEVDQTIDSIRNLFGLDIFVLINKKYLDQKGWESGMRTFGKVSDWNRFPQIVVSMHGKQFLPEVLSAFIMEMDFNKQYRAIKSHFIVGNQYAIIQILPDVSGRPVGALVMLVDTSGNMKQVKKTVLIGSGVLVIAAAILIIFFYWFVGRIAKRMAQNEFKLHQMATHDGLTDLYNRRQFDLELKESIGRYTRYHRPVSLLMIDIDHFKQVNDTYGHPAGDAILRELGNRLTAQARVADHVYRYGGEEFTILLPEIDSTAASMFAQRLCERMSSEQWDIGNGLQISLTVSIGIASCPEHADKPQALVTAADAALYAAKQAGRNRVYNYNMIDEEVDTPL